MPDRNRTWIKLWGMPVFMGLITLLGLLAAMMGTGISWHLLSWTMLAIPLYVMVRYGARFFR